jgi:hypothetical protein
VSQCFRQATITSLSVLCRRACANPARALLLPSAPPAPAGGRTAHQAALRQRGAVALASHRSLHARFFPCSIWGHVHYLPRTCSSIPSLRWWPPVLPPSASPKLHPMSVDGARSRPRNGSGRLGEDESQTEASEPSGCIGLFVPRDAQRVLTHQETGLKASFLTLLLEAGRAISDPLPVTSASIERACEAPLAESAARCASRGFVQSFERNICRECVCRD